MSKLIDWLEQKTRPPMELKDIAQALKVDQSLVSLWRAGKRKPGKRQLKNLSRLTGIKIEDLL
jgi:transcriptional regulator with XRE-family HTH domain